MTPWVVGLVGTIQPSCALISQISLIQLCWQHKFLSGIPIWAAHYSYKSGGHKQCIGLACQCKINMVPGQARSGHWEPPTDFIVSNWNMQRRNEYISYDHSPHSLSLSFLDPVRRLTSQFQICYYFWGFKLQTPSDFISFYCENNDVSSSLIIRLSTLGLRTSSICHKYLR